MQSGEHLKRHYQATELYEQSPEKIEVDHKVQMNDLLDVVFMTRANVEGHHDWCPGDLASDTNWYH